MAITTYAQLKASIEAWLNRDDLDQYVGDFIALFEATFERTARVREMLVRAVTVPAADEPRENLPGDFLELKAIQFNASPVVVPEFASAAWIRNYRRYTGAESGVPRYFTIEGGQLLFERTPNATELEILYYQKLPRLSDEQTSNWLLAAHPDIYLYGALVHSAPFLKDDERIALWAGLLEKAMTELRSADGRAQANSAPVRARTKRSAP